MLKSKELIQKFIKVNGKIKEKSLLKFIELKLDFKLTNEYKLFYNYLQFSNEYQINYYKSYSIKDLEFQNFKELILKEEVENIALLHNDYLYIFIEKEFYLLQKIEKDFNLNDLLPFINKRFNLNIEKLLDYKDSIDNCANKFKLKYLFNKSFLYIFISSFLFLNILVALLYVFGIKELNSNFEKDKSAYLREINRKKVVHYEKSLNKKFKNIFSILVNDSVKLNSITYKSKEILFYVEAINKESIYKVLKHFKKVEIESILFNKTRSVYESKFILSI